MIRDALINMINTVQGFNPYDSLSLDTFYSALSRGVSGAMKWREVDGLVSLDNVKSMFPNYISLKMVRGYYVIRCIDPLVAPFIYPCWLVAHHMWPKKDEFPLYFYKQLFANFHLDCDVDYIDIPSHVGQGKGRFSYKFKHPNASAAVNK